MDINGQQILATKDQAQDLLEALLFTPQLKPMLNTMEKYGIILPSLLGTNIKTMDGSKPGMMTVFLYPKNMI